MVKTEDSKTPADIFGLSRLFIVASEEEEEEVVQVPAMPPKAFKPYGSPPRFDLDEYKDSFELWHQQWKIFLALRPSTLYLKTMSAQPTKLTFYFLVFQRKLFNP
jgi:hypothetical protein